MAPSLLTSVSALLLGMRTVSAYYICTSTISPSTAVCGTVGYLNDFSYYQKVLFDNQYLTPEGCAAACATYPNCLSFDLGVDFCELQSGTLAQAQFGAYTGSFYQGYDLSCFTCIDTSSVSTSSTSSTTILSSSQSSIISSATPSDMSTTVMPATTTPLVCNQDNCFRALLRFSSQASDFCATYTTAIDSQPTDIPLYLDNCNGISSVAFTSAVSSGCSCLSAYKTSISSSSPTSVPASTTSISSSTSTDSSTSSQMATTSATSSQTSTSEIPTTAKSSISSSLSTISSSMTSSQSSTQAPLPISSSLSTVSNLSTTSAVSLSSPTSSNSTGTSTSSKLSTTRVSSSPIFSVPLITSSQIDHTTYPVSLTSGSSLQTSSGTTTQHSTTSTIYTTQVQTVTKCPSWVRNCPLGSVTTKTIALYTTICPVSEIFASPTPSDIEHYTVSTVYATKMYTITSCAPTVMNCPVGKVTTVTESLYTTWCPVIEVPSPTVSLGPGSAAEKAGTTTVQVSLVSAVASGKPLSVLSGSSPGDISTVTVLPLSVAASSKFAGVYSPVLAASSTPGVGASISAGIVASKVSYAVGTSAGAATSTPTKVTASGAEIIGVKWMGTSLIMVLACTLPL